MAESRANCIIVCESVHDVMALERALKSKGINNSMIPTPRQVTSDCGMALSISCTDSSLIARLAEDSDLRMTGIYRLLNDEFVLLDPGS